jgi:hypothetical protein
MHTAKQAPPGHTDIGPTHDQAHKADQPALAPFLDARPQAVAQRKLAEQIAASPRLAMQRQFAAAVGASPHQLASRRLVAAASSASGANSLPIQRYTYTHGSLTHESGTEIKTDLITPTDTGGGTPVSAWPSWWPTGGAETANDFLRENFVQGHLLNAKLGGPGGQRYNLTPLTRSANSQMSASIENVAKTYLAQGNAITYWVTADYATHPNVADVGAGALPGSEKLALQTSLDKMPSNVGAQITVHENSTGKWLVSKNQPLDVYVKNEGAALKGSFV